MDNVISTMIEETFGCDVKEFSVVYEGDGLTNKNYTVTRDNTKYVIRIGRPNSHELGINREAELAAMRQASGIGVGAEEVYFSTDSGNMITKFIEGKKWSDKDFMAEGNIARIAKTLKKVHNLPPIPYEFSPYRDIEYRIEFANRNNLILPEYLEELMTRLYSIQGQREMKRQKYYGLCHNDPFANNFLDDGAVRLIDWEYAGMGDIFFDLTIICFAYNQEQKVEFLTAYFGHCDEEMFKGLEQMSYVVTFWNAMWAVLQTKLTDSTTNYAAMADQMFSGLKSSL